MNRHEQRKIIFKILFQLDNTDLNVSEIKYYKHYMNEKYIRNIVDYYLENATKIIESIDQHLDKYTYKRLPKVDRNILKLAVSEIMFKEVPFKAILNESILLSKSYAEKDSHKFINGVLKNFNNETEDTHAE